MKAAIMRANAFVPATATLILESAMEMRIEK